MCARSMPEMAHEQRAVRSVLGHRDASLDRAAASEPGSVVAEKAIVICEGWLLHQRLAPGSRYAPVDQHDGLS